MQCSHIQLFSKSWLPTLVCKSNASARAHADLVCPQSYITCACVCVICARRCCAQGPACGICVPQDVAASKVGGLKQALQMGGLLFNGFSYLLHRTVTLSHNQIASGFDPNPLQAISDVISHPASARQKQIGQHESCNSTGHTHNTQHTAHSTQHTAHSTHTHTQHTAHSTHTHTHSERLLWTQRFESVNCKRSMCISLSFACCPCVCVSVCLCVFVSEGVGVGVSLSTCQWQLTTNVEPHPQKRN